MEEMTFEELQQIVSICLDEIVNLKEENEKLKNSIYATISSVQELSNGQEQLLMGQKQIIKNSNIFVQNVEKRFKVIDGAVENIKYELNDPQFNLGVPFYPTFYSIDETIENIVTNRSSMARFGDGEFAIMSNVIRQKFQRLDEGLASRLKEVINTKEEGFLVGIADNYGALEKYNESGKAGIRYYMNEEVRKQHAGFLDKDRKYHNAYISRPYALFSDNKTDAPRRRFDALKRIWDDRDVIFVEGALTRLGVGNDLFDNAKRIRRIEAPPENSYDKYDEILAAALQFAEENTLFLVALGPAAGVLAYDLYKAGYQAVDIGHVDLEYEWFLSGKGSRCEVKTKYNNEFPGGDLVEDICDSVFERQILCRV